MGAADASARFASEPGRCEWTQRALDLDVRVDVTVDAEHDVAGREVGRLLDASLEAGEHAVSLERRALPGGVYWVRITAGADERHARVVLLP